MSPDQIMRRALRATVFFNCVGALLFLFANSLAPLTGFPAPVPHLYSATIAFLVALFAATYAWMARQPRIDRPLTAFFALGKSGFFVVVVICWLLGEAPGRTVLAATGDLFFAIIFAWWLMTTAGEQSAERAG